MEQATKAWCIQETKGKVYSTTTHNEMNLESMRRMTWSKLKSLVHLRDQRSNKVYFRIRRITLIKDLDVGSNS